MPKLSYECRDCNGDFKVSFIFFKPKKVRCPHCGSVNVSEPLRKHGCGCGSKTADTGFKFT